MPLWSFLGTYICFGVFALMVALACIMVYEYFTPGSKLRYAICRMGSLKGTAQFYFVPKSNPNNVRYHKFYFAPKNNPNKAR